MVKPIRRDLLIHSIDYYEKNAENSGGGWGGEPEEYKEPIVVSNVRVEPKNAIVRTADGEEIQSNTTLFVDKVFSSAANWVYDSKIVWDGQTFFIKGIDPYYARADVVHHWEVRLA